MFDGQRICEKCKGGRLHNVVRNRCIKGSLPLSATVMAEAVVHRLLRSYTTCVNAFVAPSRFYIEKLTEWGWHRSQFVHVPNFVDEDKMQPSFTPGRAVVYFGRLSAEKGLLTLARAAGIAKVPVRILGDGPLRESLQAEAARSGADMVFKGHLTGQELWSEVKSARACVLPAEGYENAPMSVLESYALGKPVIGADIGGIPELIRHGSIGWIFQSGNEKELATALRRVADLPDSAIEAAGREARATVEKEYSRARYWQRMTALYATLREAA
jgi:glycosyltransferase involved in cell wall biosynthesis